MADRGSPRIQVEQSEAVFHLFREVNDHLRATEQKHLQVSIGFISVTALALSFLVPSGAESSSATEFRSWPQALAYFVLLLAGCATMFAQHSLRGWKKDYLLASKKLVYSWPVDDEFRVNWMRTDRGPYFHPDRASMFRLAGDNVLFWFVAFITTCVAAMLFISITRLVRNTWITAPVLAAACLAYATIFVYITGGGVRRKDRLEDAWELFCAQREAH